MHVDRESLAEKSLSQAFSASNVGVSFQKNKEYHFSKNKWYEIIKFNHVYHFL
jgi:hypothetical protein